MAVEPSRSNSIMDTNATKRGFLPYPTNRVAGTIEDAERANAAVRALVEAGFDRQSIDVLHGEEDVSRLDPTGAEHGFLARLQRAVIRIGGPVEEFKHLTHHVEDVRAGRFVIMVPVRGRGRRILAAEILNAHGAEFVGFYGRWAWEGLTPSGARAGAASGTEAHGDAGRPEDLVGRFVEAWNRRDPDALAALFDTRAEFVDVTGLWCHDRAAIREAHADGFERIFNAPSLAVDEFRVKRLADDVAIVHVAMTLAGQAGIAANGRTGTRKTILSFVTHRMAGRWLCASAHGTDVRPGMATGVLDAIACA